MFCLLIGIFAVSASAQVPPDEDPVKISPQYYTVRFENDQVRVLEYHLRPGEKEAMHSHPPGIVYYLSDATFLTTLPDGTVSEGSVKKGDVQWRELTRHAAENVGTTDARAFAIELKNATSKNDKN
jgi:quercetin dioxygenase-like cupin family protein